MKSIDKGITVAIIGAGGFIGKNLVSRMENLSHINVCVLETSKDLSSMELTRRIDWIINCAGINKSNNENDFWVGNVELISDLLSEASRLSLKPKVINLSSLHVGRDSVYAKTKRAGEIIVEKYGHENLTKVVNLRLPNIFGKWGKPNYNSFINTYCYNKARGLKTEVFDSKVKHKVLYVEDLIDNIILYLFNEETEHLLLQGTIEMSVDQIISVIDKIVFSDSSGISLTTQEGIEKKLYATWLSYHEERYLNTIKNSNDSGSFTEVFKTSDSGQFSILRVNPKMSRGYHFHNTKVEKFYVISGRCMYHTTNKLNMLSFKIEIDEFCGKVFYSIPGTFHTIENTGEGELVVAIWASELFDEHYPDTYYK